MTDDNEYAALKIDGFVTGCQTAFREEETKGIAHPHFIVLLPGACQLWPDAMKYFSTILQRITNEIVCKPRCTVLILWFGGYEAPQPHFSVKPTVTRPASDIGSSIAGLIEMYPEATFDFVAFSRMGFIVTGFVAATVARAPEKIAQIRRIITINSPLTGSEKYVALFEEALRNFIDRQKKKTYVQEGKELLGESNPPLMHYEFKEGSEYMQAIWDTRIAQIHSYLPELHSIRVNGDEIVPPSLAKAPEGSWDKSKRHDYPPLDIKIELGTRELKHFASLRHKQIVDRVITILST